MRRGHTVKAILCALLICGALFSGCDKSGENVYGSKVVCYYDNFFNDGELYCDSPYARLNFFDFNSMQNAIVCPQPNCPHTDQGSCSSFGMMNHPMIYGDRLYHFTTDIGYDKNGIVETTNIYSAELDGTSRIKLGSLEGGQLYYYDRAVLIDGKLYFCVTSNLYDEFGKSTQMKKYILYSYSFKENKFERLCDINNGNSSNVYIYGEYMGDIYMAFSYLEKEVTMEEFMDEENPVEFSYIGYRYNIAENSLYEYDGTVIGIYDGWLITLEDENSVFRSENGDTVTLPGQFRGRVVNGYAFDMSEKVAVELKTSRKYCLNLDDPYSEVIYFLNGDYILRGAGDSGNSGYIKIPGDELIGEMVE